MRPASRRALLKRLAAAPAPRLRWGSALVLAAAAVFLIAHFAQRTPAAAPPPAPPSRSVPILDPALALPFGSAPAAPAAAGTTASVTELRAAYAAARDRLALYRQLRAQPDPDARYLAYRTARECTRLLAAGGASAGGARARRLAAEAEACRGFAREAASRTEWLALLQEAAASGHAAAQLAAAAENFAPRSAAETAAFVARALTSADPLAFDEARVLLAMARHQLVLAGVAPEGAADLGRIDPRVVALDLANCRLGNPCGPSRGAPAVDCAGDAACLAEAQQWLLDEAELEEDEIRAAGFLADRVAAAFRRGTIDEIVRAAR
jgi:hypothetical protein